ncbi:hypothetical protein H6P81_006499 [Aristolochia fimbriata]|uniref:Uncharacterized protein n=1 Tax=Aristolochia fimbriata TaxID=158543 RepID=A0AAV7EZN3_ARIFI|nr:hypothetical protein H6P81_006499 [Aristolochia fimbriata]
MKIKYITLTKGKKITKEAYLFKKEHERWQHFEIPKILQFCPRLMNRLSRSTKFEELINQPKSPNSLRTAGHSRSASFLMNPKGLVCLMGTSLNAGREHPSGPVMALDLHPSPFDELADAGDEPSRTSIGKGLPFDVEDFVMVVDGTGDGEDEATRTMQLNLAMSAQYLLLLSTLDLGCL